MNFNPEEFRIIRLAKHDEAIFQKLIRLFEDVFEMETPINIRESYLHDLLEKPGFIAFVVLNKDEVIGGLTAFEIPLYYSECSEIFIYDVAVKTEFQRSGLGKRLLLALNDYCKQNGIKEFFVAAHEEDEHALDFYRANGGKEERVRHFNFDVNQ